MKKILRLVACLIGVLQCSSGFAATFTIADGDVSALKAAIHAANTNGQQDTIELAPGGRYLLAETDSPLNGLPPTLSDEGQMLAFHGNGATLLRTPTAREGFRFFQISSGANLELFGLVMERGDALLVGANGGAILNQNGMLSVDHCVFRSNAAVSGGAIYYDKISGSASLRVTNSCFVSNGAYFGAGVYNRGFPGSATANIVSRAFLHNQASGNYNNGRGAGIYNDNRWQRSDRDY